MYVLLLPGYLGSEMYAVAWAGLPGRRIWPELAPALDGELALLQLGLDGSSPGPLARGYSCIAGRPVPAVYRPLWLALTLRGHAVDYRGWDWRRDLPSEGARLWSSLAPALGSQPLGVVAHSAGGLLALALYGAMLAAGAGAQLTRLCTLGCPVYGTWAAVRMWLREHPWYRQLRALQGWPRAPRVGPDYLDATVASWPCVYQLQPYGSAGPLAQQYPDQAAAIYEPAYYRGGNPYLSQQWWAQAQVAQAQLLSSIPPCPWYCLLGVTTPTWDHLTGPLGPTGLPSQAAYSAGDDTVTVAQGTPPGVVPSTIDQRHELLPLDPRCWAYAAAAMG